MKVAQDVKLLNMRNHQWSCSWILVVIPCTYFYIDLFIINTMSSPQCDMTYVILSFQLFYPLCFRCDPCVETLWARRSTALPCPNCGAQLFRDGFRLQLFANAAVEKEINIRRRILKEHVSLSLLRIALMYIRILLLIFWYITLIFFF